MNGRFAAMIAVALIGAMTASCGGSDGSNDESTGETAVAPPVKTSQLVKAAYVREVNAQCARLRKNLVREASAYLLEQTSGKPEPLGSTKEEVSNAKLGKAVIVPTVEKEIAVIQKQGAPAGDEKQIESILAAEQKAIDEVKGLEKTESIQDIIDRFAPATEALDKYGLKACGN